MQENELFLNISKTEYVIYGSHQRLKREESIILSCNGSSVIKSESFKFFSVVIAEPLSFNTNIGHVVKNVWRKLGVSRRLKISIPMSVAERLLITRRWF